jgi:hypothetical protein
MDDDEAVLPCQDKMAFDSQDEAESSALAVDWQHGEKLSVYQCKHCELWHLSSGG